MVVGPPESLSAKALNVGELINASSLEVRTDGKPRFVDVLEILTVGPKVLSVGEMFVGPSDVLVNILVCPLEALIVDPLKSLIVGDFICAGSFEALAVEEIISVAPLDVVIG